MLFEMKINVLCKQIDSLSHGFGLITSVMSRNQFIIMFENFAKFYSKT